MRAQESRQSIDTNVTIAKPLRGSIAVRCFTIIVLFIVASAIDAFAQDPGLLDVASAAPISVAQASPAQDDAGLYDVQFLGTRIGWAVGDHGTVWRSVDGGQSWVFVPCPAKCTLRSVCFLTDRVGWVAGGGITPHTRQGFGVVYSTTDGGQTWKPQGDDTLPPIFYIKFFGTEQGVAVGESSPEHPTGVLTTANGGKTWQSIVGKDHPGWRTACFVAPDAGIVGGLRGASSLVGDKQLQPTRLPETGLRAFHDVTIQNDATGWLVGDGGLVMQTETGGLVWQDPATPLPIELNEIFDFRAVASRGGMAWIAGAPGSTIWHTPDRGQTWLAQHTGQSLPIHSITFTDDTHGWAVGALGLTLQTTDGGATWNTVRGGRRRAAMLAVHPRASRISFHLAATESAENGYRSVAILPARYDVGVESRDEQDLDLRLHDAIVSAGGATGLVSWKLPVALPDIEKSKPDLIADWRRRTDRDLSQLLLGTFVCWIRTWRPSVVIIDEPPTNDAVGNVLNDALYAAVEQAADPTRFVSQLQLANLGTWQTQKVFVRLPHGSQGQIDLDPHEYLPRLGRTAHEIAAGAAGRMTQDFATETGLETYRLEVDHTNLPNAAAARHDFFTGLSLSPNSEARRALPAFDDAESQQRRKIAEKQRHMHGYLDKYLDDPRHAAQIIAQLSFVTEGMSNEQAALQLSQVADEYRSRSQWDLYESTLTDLIARYSDEPISLVAMRQLLHLWTGAEPVWQRIRKVNVNRRELQQDTRQLVDRVGKAIEASRTGQADEFNAEQELIPDPYEFVDKGSDLKAGGYDGWQQGAVKSFNTQAVQLAKFIQKKSPKFFRTPETQFAVAALMRNSGAPQLADNYYHRSNLGTNESPWSATAASELWLATPHGGSPKRMGVCRSTAKAPYLDGDLADECWQAGDPILLTGNASRTEKDVVHSATMFTYDNRYLYVAARIPRNAKAPADFSPTASRSHDADLSGFDRLNLFLDLDRDYATYYAFAIDQRGQTAESCWGDRAWDPKWHLATKADEDFWCIEAAIPFEELMPRAPVRGSVWAIGAIRTIPSVGIESWTKTTSGEPHPETFGMLRFD